jgi:hypothetical protein
MLLQKQAGFGKTYGFSPAQHIPGLFLVGKFHF